jgi:CheY-like chemotaxis protein
MASVLVADDDANTRMLVRAVLTSAGHTVSEAKDGAEALAQTAAERPDLILLDLSLPDISGTELVRALRADPQTALTMIALYTATPMNVALRDFMQIHGIAGAVPKPSEPAELVRAVAEILRRS